MAAPPWRQGRSTQVQRLARAGYDIEVGAADVRRTPTILPLPSGRNGDERE